MAGCDGNDVGFTRGRISGSSTEKKRLISGRTKCWDGETHIKPIINDSLAISYRIVKMVLLAALKLLPEVLGGIGHEGVALRGFIFDPFP
jgi:hypothetical protein